MSIDEILLDVDGLYLATEKYISNSLKNKNEDTGALIIIFEELDKISEKLTNLKNMQNRSIDESKDEEQRTAGRTNK